MAPPPYLISLRRQHFTKTIVRMDLNIGQNMPSGMGRYHGIIWPILKKELQYMVKRITIKKTFAVQMNAPPFHTCYLMQHLPSFLYNLATVSLDFLDMNIVRIVLHSCCMKRSWTEYRQCVTMDSKYSSGGLPLLCNQWFKTLNLPAVFNKQSTLRYQQHLMPRRTSEHCQKCFKLHHTKQVFFKRQCSYMS